MKKISGNDEKSIQKRIKKRLIIIIISILGVISVLGIASIVIDMLSTGEEEFVVDYDFYPADFEEYIFDDEKYTALIAEEFIKYTDSTTNETVGITKDNASEQGSEVKFIVDMIYDAINGDSEAYNARFSSEYYETHSPKNRFTMQKIYDVVITFISTENGDDYTKSIYCVEYKIYQNNGTFRKDIGEGSKKQYFTINTNGDGEILVDAVSTVNIAKRSK